MITYAIIFFIIFIELPDLNTIMVKHTKNKNKNGIYLIRNTENDE